MKPETYDFANPPSAADWLAIDESERIDLVEAAHRAKRSAVGQNAVAHASIHVVVEDRLATGDAGVVAAYERCRAAGVDRHNTIHALGSVVTRHMLAVLEQGKALEQVDADRDFAAIDPTAWMRKR